MRLESLRRSRIVTLVVCTTLLPLPTSLAADAAIFSGKVVDRDGFTPRAGVVVRLVETDTERTFASTPTAEQGTFRIETVPAGSYAVLAETGEGKYLATDRVELGPGENTPVQLALEPGAAPLLAPGQTRGDLPGWAKGVIAGGLVVVAVVLFEDSREQEASKGAPF